MTVVAVQVLISSSALSCELNQMFCIKIVIWQLVKKKKNLYHMQSNNNLEKLVLCIQPSLRINLTFWSQLQLSDEPKVQVVPLKHVGLTAMTWWNHPNWKHSHPCSSVSTSGPLFCSLVFVSNQDIIGALTQQQIRKTASLPSVRWAGDVK